MYILYGCAWFESIPDSSSIMDFLNSVSINSDAAKWVISIQLRNLVRNTVSTKFALVIVHLLSS